VEIDVASEQVTAGVAVHVHVRLAPRELNRLYLAGDTLIQLPVDGITVHTDGAPIHRTGIFLSELAGTSDGFTRVFVDADHADRYMTAVRDQIETALEGS